MSVIPEGAAAPGHDLQLPLEYDDAVAREILVIKMLHNEMGHPEITGDESHASVMAAVEAVERAEGRDVYGEALARMRDRMMGGVAAIETTQVVAVAQL